MRKPHFTVDFKTMSDPLFENKANFVLASMTGNKSYPKPSPTLKVLGAAIKKYSAALVLAQDGGSKAVAAKKQQRNIVTDMLVDLIGYCTFEAKGDIVIMKSAGLTVSSGVVSSKSLGEIRNFKLKPGKNSGEVKGSFSVDDAVSYTYCYTQTPVTPNSTWTMIPGTHQKFVLEGLLRGVEYAVRVGVVGSKKQITYSQPLIIMVT